jgi:hypothetical protein
MPLRPRLMTELAEINFGTSKEKHRAYLKALTNAKRGESRCGRNAGFGTS